RGLVRVRAEAGGGEEQAGQAGGARPGRALVRVTLPGLRGALSGGVMLTAARALGEFGAVLVVSGGLIGTTETATLYIFRALDERNDVGAYAVAVVLGAISVMLLLVLESRKRRRRR